MEMTELRDRLRRAQTNFQWDQWVALGLAGHASEPPVPFVIDPEHPRSRRRSRAIAIRRDLTALETAFRQAGFATLYADTHRERGETLVEGFENGTASLVRILETRERIGEGWEALVNVRDRSQFTGFHQSIVIPPKNPVPAPRMVFPNPRYNS